MAKRKTLPVWESDDFLCDTCIWNDENTQCCGAEDCFGGDNYDNQLRLMEEQNDCKGTDRA